MSDDFAARLRSAEPGRTRLRGLWLTFLGPFGLEVAATAGADWVGVDLQHGDVEVRDLPPLLRASRVPVLARVASDDPAHVARVLDTGVDGVIVPGVESGAQVAGLVAAAHVPPAGSRSTGLSRAGVVGASARPLVLPMIETQAGLEAAPEIVAAPGVDGVFLGPYDLALSLGQPSVRSAPVVSALESVVAAVHEAGRVAGVFAGDAEIARRLSHVELLGVDSDAAALRAGLDLLFGAGAGGAARRVS